MLGENLYYKINEYVNQESKERPSRNYNYFITEPKAHAISIVYQFENNSTYPYHGLHPRISEVEVRGFVLYKNSPLQDEKSLFEYVEEHKDYWTTNIQDDELNKALFAKSLLVTASHFYIAFNIEDPKVFDKSKELFSQISGTLNDFHRTDINTDIYSADEKNKKIKFYGRIPNFILEKFDQEEIYFYKHNTHIYLCNEKRENTFRMSDFYKEDISEYLQCVSSMFYSGVLARVKHIEQPYTNPSNKNISVIKLTLGKITYATHCAFKDPRYNYHSYLKDHCKKLLEFDRNEVELQNRYLNFLNDNKRYSVKEAITQLNTYLENSYYTHGMNVSANVMTADNYCIYTKRGTDTWDSSAIYCSANGVCEVFDRNVKFYRESVDVDIPTLHDDGLNNYGSFNGELTRETLAELGALTYHSKWSYYGFCVMGFKQSVNDTHRFPLHFNILAKNTTEYTFNQLRKASLTAVEKEENDNIFGYRLEVFNSHCKMIGDSIINVLNWLSKQKDIAIAIIVLIGVIKNISQAGTNNERIVIVINQFLSISAINLIEFITTLTLIILLFINGIRKIKKFSSDRKNKKDYRIILNKETREKRMIDINKKILGNKFANANTIALLMTILYFLDIDD